MLRFMALLLAVGSSMYGCGSAARCNYEFAYRAGATVARRGDRLGGYPGYCAAPVRSSVERGYREGFFAELGCQLPADLATTEVIGSDRCNFDFAYRAGINDALRGAGVSGFAAQCDESIRSEVERGYQTGYSAATTCSQQRLAAEQARRAQEEAARAAQLAANPPPPPPPPPANGGNPFPGIPGIPGLPGLPGVPTVQGTAGVQTSQPSGGTSQHCCVNRQYYDCPSVMAVDRCAGESSRCVLGCNGDFRCVENCMRQHPPDPSGCNRNPSRDSSC